MVINKKGAEGLPWWLILLVIAIVVLVIVAPSFANFYGGTKDTIGAIDPQASSVSIDACKNYCDSISGSGGIYTAESAKYNYCNKKLKFVDKEGKEKSATCYEMVVEGSSYVAKCNVGCS